MSVDHTDHLAPMEGLFHCEVYEASSRHAFWELQLEAFLEVVSAHFDITEAHDRNAVLTSEASTRHQFEREERRHRATAKLSDIDHVVSETTESYGLTRSNTATALTRTATALRLSSRGSLNSSFRSDITSPSALSRRGSLSRRLSLQNLSFGSFSMSSQSFTPLHRAASISLLQRGADDVVLWELVEPHEEILRNQIQERHQFKLSVLRVEMEKAVRVKELQRSAWEKKVLFVTLAEPLYRGRVVSLEASTRGLFNITSHGEAEARAIVERAFRHTYPTHWDAVRERSFDHRAALEQMQTERWHSLQRQQWVAWELCWRHYVDATRRVGYTELTYRLGTVERQEIVARVELRRHAQQHQLMAHEASQRARDTQPCMVGGMATVRLDIVCLMEAAWRRNVEEDETNAFTLWSAARSDDGFNAAAKALLSDEAAARERLAVREGTAWAASMEVHRAVAYENVLRSQVARQWHHELTVLGDAFRFTIKTLIATESELIPMWVNGSRAILGEWFVGLVELSVQCFIAAEEQEDRTLLEDTLHVAWAEALAEEEARQNARLAEATDSECYQSPFVSPRGIASPRLPPLRDAPVVLAGGIGTVPFLVDPTPVPIGSPAAHRRYLLPPVKFPNLTPMDAKMNETVPPILQAMERWLLFAKPSDALDGLIQFLEGSPTASTGALVATRQGPPLWELHRPVESLAHRTVMVGQCAYPTQARAFCAPLTSHEAQKAEAQRLAMVREGADAFHRLRALPTMSPTPLPRVTTTSGEERRRARQPQPQPNNLALVLPQLQQRSARANKPKAKRKPV